MHTQRVLPSPVHRQRFGGLAGQVGVVAVPVRLETDVLPRRICTPSSASLDGHSQRGHEEHAVDGSAPDTTGLPVLTLIEQKALLVGLSDGLQRRSIRHPEPRGVLRALLRLVFGHRGVTPAPWNWPVPTRRFRFHDCRTARELHVSGFPVRPPEHC